MDTEDKKEHLAKNEDDPNIDPAAEFIQHEIQSRDVVIFSNTRCIFSEKAKSIFHDCDYIYYTIELNSRTDGSELLQALEKLTGNGQTPFVFLKGEYIGGAKDFSEINETDKIRVLLDVPPRPMYPLNSVYKRTTEYLKKKYSIEELSDPGSHLLPPAENYLQHQTTPPTCEDMAQFTSPDTPSYITDMMRYFFMTKYTVGPKIGALPY